MQRVIKDFGLRTRMNTVPEIELTVVTRSVDGTLDSARSSSKSLQKLVPLTFELIQTLLIVFLNLLMTGLLL